MYTKKNYFDFIYFSRMYEALMSVAQFTYRISDSKSTFLKIEENWR